MLWEGGFDWNPPAVTLWEISVSNASLKLYPKPINGFQHGYATFTAIQTLQSSHPPLAMLLLHWSLQCGDTSYPPTQIKKWFSSFFRLQSGLCPHSDQQKKKKKKKKKCAVSHGTCRCCKGLPWKWNMWEKGDRTMDNPSSTYQSFWGDSKISLAPISGDW